MELVEYQWTSIILFSLQQMFVENIISVLQTAFVKQQQFKF